MPEVASIPAVNNFKKTRLADIKKQDLYSDGFDVPNRYDRSKGYEATDLDNLDEVLEALDNADSNKEPAVLLSEKLYATNKIYQQLIDNFVDANLVRYVVVPKKTKTGKILSSDAYRKMYDEMIDVVDGLSLEVKVPQILRALLIDGAVYFTSFYSKDNNAINLIILPWKFCKKIGETALASKVVMFNFAYFDSMGLSEEQLKEVLASFPPEFTKAYNAYKKDSKKKWQTLDIKYSSAILLNPKAIPTFLYVYAGIINYQHYTNNEITRSDNQVENLVVQKIPTYQDKLILEIPEMQALHNKVAPIVKSASHTRLITTIGDVSVHSLQEQDTRENEVLSKAYKSIFEMTGLNSELFAGSNAEALKFQERIMRSMVWERIEDLVNSLNVIVNNQVGLASGYQANITMLSVSRDSTKDDIQIYHDAAALGIGITNYIVASGIKQTDIESYLDMEENLGYTTRLKPLLSSYTATDSTPTQSGTDSKETDETGKNDNSDSDSNGVDSTSDADNANNNNK